MKLFDYFYQYDYSHEYYLNIFCTKRFNLIQFDFSWSNCPSRPIILINIFGESFFGGCISFGRFSFSFDIFAYFPRNLNDYREYKDSSWDG